MSRQAGSRSVFVGNIPYEMSEEQLTDVFKEAGPVVSFRLMFDRDTGKPRGYGFCEFQDSETAASAVRNLNNYDVGGRQLRVDYADNNPSVERGGGGGGNVGGPPPVGGRPEDREFRDLPRRKSPPRERDVPNRGHGPPPPFVGGSPNPQSSQQAITSTLSSMNQIQLFDFISQMKMFSAQSPEHARAFLAQNPHVSYAVFQGLVMMNLVDSNTLQRILQSSPGISLPPMKAAPQPLQQPPSHGYMEGNGPYPAVPPMMAKGGFSSTTHPLPPKPMIPHVPSVHPQQQPAAHQAPPQHPPQHPPPQTQPLPPAALSFEEHQKQLLLQVLNLTQAQIDSLPLDQRASVQALKQQIMMGQGGP